MDKEKKIEEMARVMCEHFEPCMQDKPCTDCKTYGRNCYTIHKAKLLSEAGYGDIAQAVKEFERRAITVIEDIENMDDKAWAYEQIRNISKEICGIDVAR